MDAWAFSSSSRNSELEAGPLDAESVSPSALRWQRRDVHCDGSPLQLWLLDNVLMSVLIQHEALEEFDGFAEALISPRKMESRRYVDESTMRARVVHQLLGNRGLQLQPRGPLENSLHGAWQKTVVTS